MVTSSDPNCFTEADAPTNHPLPSQHLDATGDDSDPSERTSSTTTINSNHIQVVTQHARDCSPVASFPLTSNSLSVPKRFRLDLAPKLSLTRLSLTGTGTMDSSATPSVLDAHVFALFVKRFVTYLTQDFSLHDEPNHLCWALRHTGLGPPVGRSGEGQHVSRIHCPRQSSQSPPSCQQPRLSSASLSSSSTSPCHSRQQPNNTTTTNSPLSFSSHPSGVLDVRLFCDSFMADEYVLERTLVLIDEAKRVATGAVCEHVRRFFDDTEVSESGVRTTEEEGCSSFMGQVQSLLRTEPPRVIGSPGGPNTTAATSNPTALHGRTATTTPPFFFPNPSARGFGVEFASMGLAITVKFDITKVL